jgi:hypothetical protein
MALKIYEAETGKTPIMGRSMLVVDGVIAQKYPIPT